MMQHAKKYNHENFLLKYPESLALNCISGLFSPEGNFAYCATEVKCSGGHS